MDDAAPADDRAAAARSRSAGPSLAARLVAGCLALIVSTAIPTTEYMDLSKSAVRPGDAEAPPQPRAMPVTVAGFERRGSVAREADPTGLAASRQRIAANILLRSGYLTSASMETDPSTGASMYTFALRPEVLECATQPPAAAAAAAVAGAVAAAANNPPGALDAEQARLLAIAAVAVEKFNRNPVQRKLEWWFAEAGRALTGRLPDLSLGPAQIRPSTLRRLTGQPGARADLSRLAGDDQALAEALSDECSALSMAAALIAAQACKACDDAAGDAVKAYAGQRRQVGAVIDHAEIVRTIAALIR